MEPIKESLDAQHAQLDRELEAVIAAGRAGGWAEYRRRFAALREGLARHMAFEHEALFPHLAQDAAAAVDQLREQHEGLDRQLEMLGAAAPEHDPEGCLAALEELAVLMRLHHAAEMALDPSYASRPAPSLGLSDPPPMDLRGLQPPEPMVRILQALERGAAPLCVILPHEPAPLYPLLFERGFSWSGAARADGGYQMIIRRA